jgi:hypothetical protein
VEHDGTTAGQLASSGLRIDLEISDRTIPALSQLFGLLDALPPLPDLAPGAPTLADVLVTAQARHLVRLEVARGAVSLSATPAVELADLPVPPSPSAPAALPLPTPAPSSLAPPALAPVPAAPPAPDAARPAASLPDLPLGAGIGALGVLLLLVQPFAGARLARMADALLAADDTVACPWEEG